MYSALASEHFHQPRRVGPLEGATHTGTAGTPGEGPYVVLYLRVEGEKIAHAAYQTFGCPAAIAASSVMAELLEGASVAAARAMTLETLNAALGEASRGEGSLPEARVSGLQSGASQGRRFAAWRRVDRKGLQRTWVA